MKNLKIILFICQALVLSLFSITTSAQIAPTDSIPPDPARISVYAIQDLRFGAFTQGPVGGKVIISPMGIRTVTGDLVQLNMGVIYSEAIFELESIVGTSISINNGPNATLIGSNGGSMTMTIGASDPVSPFVTSVHPPGTTQIKIGGTLTVGNPVSNPPGTYTGSIFITFNQE